jgi:hypothetical protein
MLTEAESKLTKQVAELFKENYRNGPLPSEAQCYQVAVEIIIVRNRNYKKTFPEDSAALRKRRTKVAATRRLIDHRKKVLAAQLESLRLPGWLEDYAHLDALEAALELATPALLQPFDPLAGERDAAWWHKAAFMISQRVRTALEQAGNTNISYQKDGDFLVVVVAALELAGIHYAHSTVAKVLAKTERVQVSRTVWRLGQ